MKKESQKILRVAITGPESTGKSTLAKALANHYQTNWVREYARKYIDHLDRPYNYEDLLNIAKGQIDLEENSSENTNRFIFLDTDLLVIKIWSEHKYGKVHPEILKEFYNRRYDFYLLMDIDLPWAYDPQREHPNKRQFFFKWFQQELTKISADYKIISGNDNQRLRNAIDALEDHFRK